MNRLNLIIAILSRATFYFLVAASLLVMAYGICLGVWIALTAWLGQSGAEWAVSGLLALLAFILCCLAARGDVQHEQREIKAARRP